MRNLSIRTLLISFIAIVGVQVLAMFGLTMLLGNAEHEAMQRQANRYSSYLLADELRQSSDDLTRLARTYVVSGGKASYEQQYNDILDIRNGKKPRPAEYQRIYWDFVSAGQASPRPDTVAVPLLDLMKQAGFADDEFGMLKEAQANSNDLVNTEVKAMNAVKGRFDDGSGKYEKIGAPQLELARDLMHSPDYHVFKAKIMKPLDQFFNLLDQRTSREVAAAEGRISTIKAWLLAVEGVALVIAVSLGLFVLSRIRRELGGEPAYARGVAKRIAAGDLTQNVEVKANDTSSLLAEMKTMQDKLGSVVGTIRESTDAVGTSAREIAQGNADLSQRTEQQAASLEETASSMEELTSTVKQNADNARQANQLAASASEVAVKGGRVVSQVVDTMGSISASSKKIADIISVIDGIAFQTNILALNAAVEAARAGEQGRGFAVVASEVRNLAQRSAAAAKEIKDLIGDSVAKVDAGTRLVDEAGKTMNEVVASVKRVTDIMAEISAASMEQSSGIEQVNQAIVQMDAVTQQNAALVEESAAAAESMEDQARELQQVVSTFKVANGGAATVAKAVVERVRLASKSKVPAPAAPRLAAKAGGAPPRPKLLAKAKTGADDEWAEF